MKFSLQISLVAVLFTCSTVRTAAQQECYVQLDEASGFNVLPYQDALEAKACELKTIFDTIGFEDSFHVFSFGFYMDLEYYDGYSYPQAFIDMKTQVAQQSPYYLLIGRQTDHTGIFTKFWVDVKLPEEGNFECLTEIDRTLLNINIKTIINKRYEDEILKKLPNNFYLAEITGMDSLFSFIEKQIFCCIPGTGNRTLECLPCPTPEDIKTFFIDNGFEQSEIEILPGTLPPSKPNENGRYMLTVTNYANQLYREDGVNINPEQFLATEINNALSDGLEAKAYITNNSNFCNIEISNDIKNSFDIPQLDAAIHIHLWENPDTTNSDILFVQFFPMDSIPLELPTVLVSAPTYSCTTPYQLPSFCPPYPYSITKDLNDFKFYGYNCDNGVWNRGDSVEYIIRRVGDNDNEDGWADGISKNLARAHINGTVHLPDGGSYEEIVYIPSLKAYRMAVKVPQKFPTTILTKKLYKGFMKGPNGTIYEESGNAIYMHFLLGKGGDWKWNCQTQVSQGISEIEIVENEINTIEGIFEWWLHSHNNFDSLFTPHYRDTFTNSSNNLGPNLTYYFYSPSNTTPAWAGAIFGGTQGRQIQIKQLNKYGNCYKIELLYTIYDNFGVGNSDGAKWYFPGLVPFWVLQHYRNYDCCCPPCFVPVTNHSVEFLTELIICDP